MGVSKGAVNVSLSGTFSLYDYLGFGSHLLFRDELLWLVEKISWELESQPNIYLCGRSYECICPDMLMGTAVELAHLRCQDAKDLKPKLRALYLFSHSMLEFPLIAWEHLPVSQLIAISVGLKCPKSLQHGFMGSHCAGDRGCIWAPWHTRWHVWLHDMSRDIQDFSPIEIVLTWG